MDSLYFPEPPPAPPRTARHGEGVSGQAAPVPRLDDLPQVPGHERDHSNPVGADHSVQGPGNRAAYQRTDLQLRQVQRLLHWKLSGQHLLRFRDDLPGFDPDQQNLQGAVENRRDSIVPAGKRCVHEKPRITIFHWYCILRTNTTLETVITISICNK